MANRRDTINDDPNASIDDHRPNAALLLDHRLPSVCNVFGLLTVMVAGQQITYMTSQFYSAKLPGNKWINGIEFGAAQFFSYSLANSLLTRMTEVQAFDVLLALCAVSQTIMIAFPFAGVHIYVAHFFLVASACGMFSAWLLILEKRVPPKNSGAVLLLARTLSVAMSAASPSIAMFPAPMPHIITLSLCVMSFFAVRKLPPAGCFSPTLTQEGEVLSEDKGTPLESPVKSNAKVPSSSI